MVWTFHLDIEWSVVLATIIGFMRVSGLERQDGGYTSPELKPEAFQQKAVASSPECNDNRMSLRYISSHGNVSLQANFIACSVADVPSMPTNATSNTCTADVCIWIERMLDYMNGIIVLKDIFILPDFDMGVSSHSSTDQWLLDLRHYSSQHSWILCGVHNRCLPDPCRGSQKWRKNMLAFLL